MARLRTFALMVGAAAVTAGVATVVVRLSRGHARGVQAPGGILMGDAAGYDSFSGRLLRSFYGSVATDVADSAPTGGRVLEVGCGPGHLSIQMARDHGLEVTAVDLDPAMIERARANARRQMDGELTKLSFAVADVAAMPFADASFDLVVSTLSMHHWADPAAAQAEIARVLAPGGRALVWDIRPGAVPFHRDLPDPLEHVHGSRLRLAGAEPWLWPWRFKFTQRIELEPVPG
jgi:SAM-dependent methyltransferase